MKLLKNSESGQALVMALILLALGSLLIVPGLNLSTTSLRYHQLIEGNTLESYSADSGMQYALTKLYNNPGGYTEEQDYLIASFDLNDRSVNVTAHYESGGIYKITSTATSDNGRSTTIESYINLSAGAFAYAVAAKTSLTITSGATVNATELGGANIHSNGNITLASGALVEGNASAVGTISGWETTVTGEVKFPSPPVDFPGDYSELYKVLAQEHGSHVGNVTLDSKNPIDLPGDDHPYAYIQGNLTIWTNTIVRVNSTIYVTGTLTMKSGSRLDGQQNIFAEGTAGGTTIDITGGGVTSTLIPVVIAKNGNISCGGSNQIINAVVYAPNGTVTLGSNVRLYGAVGGNTVNMGSGSLVTYSALLHGRQDLPGGELTTIAYSYK